MIKLNKKGKILTLYQEPKEINLEKRNLKINYSVSKFINYNNAKIRIKINDFYSALLLCNECLEIDETFIKAILLKSYIFFELNDCHRGYSNMFLADELEPTPKNNSTLSKIMLRKYLSSIDRERAYYIVEYLQFIKKRRHQYIYDI